MLRVLVLAVILLPGAAPWPAGVPAGPRPAPGPGEVPGQELPLDGPTSPFQCGDDGGVLARGRLAGGREVPSCRVGHVDASAVLHEASHSMDVLARVRVETARNTSTLLLRLHRDMEVRSVSEPSLGPLHFDRPWGYWVEIDLPARYPAASSFELELVYGGEVLNSEDGGASFWDRVGTDASWVRCYGQFFPWGEEYDRSTNRLEVTAPSDKQVVAPGELVGERPNGDGTTTTEWECRTPVSGISFVAGNFTRSVQPVGGRVLDIYFWPGHAAQAPAYAAELGRLASFYSSYLGLPAFKNLTVVEVPSTYAAWGQSVPSMMWLASRNFDSPSPFQLVQHEMAHQWWGIDVEGRGATENWIQEGFSGYCQALYEMEVSGSRTYLDHCREQYRIRFVDAPEPELPLVSNGYYLSSFKGPWVLHMLRHVLGDGDFNRSLASFHVNFTGKRVDHLDYQAHVEGATGKELDDFFSFWLHTTQHLDLAVAAAEVFEADNGTDQVACTVEDRGQPSRMQVDIGLFQGARELALFPRAWDGLGPSAALRFQVGFHVDTVVIDPRGWLLDVALSNNELPAEGAALDAWTAGLSVEPASPFENETFAVVAVVSGTSTRGAERVSVGLLADGAPAAGLRTTVGGGPEQDLRFELSLPSGTHRLEVVVDDAAELYERREDNNAANLTVEVRPRPPPLPELRIVPGTLSAGPAGLIGGMEARLGALVENLGGSDAAGVEVDFWVTDLGSGPVGRSAPQDIPAGAARFAGIAWGSQPGRHQLAALVDPLGSVPEGDRSDNAASAEVYINARPVAILVAEPTDITAWDWVELSGQRSVDDGRLASFFFDFGDGTDSGWTSDGKTLHRYRSRGTYQARLRVQDDSGAESDWSPAVTIRAVAPAPGAAMDIGPRGGSVLTTFSFVAVVSPEDGRFECAWSFGDGRTARGPSVNHSYASKGSFNVTLDVTDELGRTARASARVAVRDLPPLPALSADRLRVLVGEKVSFSAEGTTDPDDAFFDLGFSWDFGGGQKASGPSVSHCFSRPGDFEVVLEVSDGTETATAAVRVEVRSPAPPPEPAEKGPRPWLVLGILLAMMGLLVAYIASAPSEDEEED